MPDLNLESLFKKNFTQVVFLLGSVMNPKDLERAQVIMKFYLKQIKKPVAYYGSKFF